MTDLFDLIDPAPTKTPPEPDPDPAAALAAEEAARRAAAAFRLDPDDPVRNIVWSDVADDGTVRVLAARPVAVDRVEAVGCRPAVVDPAPPCVIGPGGTLRLDAECGARRRYDAARFEVRYRFAGSDRTATAVFRARRDA
ncbi:hypothetical protein [Bifidobacterium myosotis]|uniref:Uncharacterized protein n=1 Tax=Bifidobacterium myosotis TaxID=1630166 RepID=A0A5M9ZH88_9BIFI|nr:hypothetical protein [Bifidobacterium myosotis]KAA8826964.1 hypothetical protein EMO91_10560 [Bifidobacterium myosotis]